MKLTDSALAAKLGLRKKREPLVGDFNRASRRAMGIRTRIGQGQSLTSVPRYVRRHYKEVMAVPFTWRTIPGRRERKVRARIKRIMAKRGLG